MDERTLNPGDRELRAPGVPDGRVIAAQKVRQALETIKTERPDLHRLLQGAWKDAFGTTGHTALGRLVLGETVTRALASKAERREGVGRG